MAPLLLGRPAPWFAAPTHSNPGFAFSSLGGRYVLLIFLPADTGAAATLMSAVLARASGFKVDGTMCFFVASDPAHFAAQAETAAIRWFLDQDGEVRRLYGALDATGAEHCHWLLVDPSIRTIARGGLDDLPGMFAVLSRLPAPDNHAGTPLHAPVLIAPRIFEPALCRRLIDYYEAKGGTRSGVMMEIDGKTVGVLNDFKSRRDAMIEDEALRAEIRRCIGVRLIPEIRKSFQYNATRMERYIVAAYDAAEGGCFLAHRDNTTAGTAHRRFACSINLNAEEFEGGDLRFSEFGSRTYRPPTGGAVVFSCSLLHEATRVTRGRRYAFLPFFYDEAAAQIREANAHTLGDPGAGAEPGIATQESPPRRHGPGDKGLLARHRRV